MSKDYDHDLGEVDTKRKDQLQLVLFWFAGNSPNLCVLMLLSIRGYHIQTFKIQAT